MKALIVEDDFVNAKTLQHLLAPLCDTTRAATGSEGIHAISESFSQGVPYDLLFLDIMLPGSDGHSVLHYLRTEEERRQIFGNQAAKVIMVSALNDSENVLTAFRIGCEGYLTKPISGKKLTELLEKLGFLKQPDEQSS